MVSIDTKLNTLIKRFGQKIALIGTVIQLQAVIEL